MNYLYPLSRVLIALIFILSGVSKITNYEATLSHMAQAGLPAPAVLLVIAAAAELLGGIAVLLGLYTRLAAMGLVLYMIPVTLIFHAMHMFDPAQGQMQTIQVLKNLAIIGGLIRLAVAGAGMYSLDESDTFRSHRRRVI